MTRALFYFVEGGKVHNLAVKKDFFPAVFSGALHTGGRDIAVPELETLIASGQHILAFKSLLVPAGHYCSVADFVMGQAALRLITQVLKKAGFLDG